MTALKRFFGGISTAFGEWRKDNAPRLGAALAFYATFALAPLMLVILAIAGMVYGREAKDGQVAGQLEKLLGKDAASAVAAMLVSSAKSKSTTVWAGIIGVVSLLLGASGVFGQLKDALNTIWDAKPKAAGNAIWRQLRARFFSFSMVLGTGFLLLVSLTVSALTTVLADYLGQFVALPVGVLRLVDIVLSFGMVTFLFAAIFKILPDVPLRWRDVWGGAALTSVLFAIGKTLIGWYLGRSDVATAYGAAGSFVIVLLWVYYSAQILLYGAEFTKASTNLRVLRGETSPKVVPKVHPAAAPL